MRAFPFFLSFLLLLSPALSFAQNESEPSSPPSVPQVEGLVAVKAVTVDGTPATGMPLVISATSASGTTTYRLITDRAGTVLLTLGKGNYHLACLLDNITTGGADFAATSQLVVPGMQNLTIVFYPAGSVAVEAVEGGKPVPGAEVHASCASDWFDYEAINGEDASAGEAGNYLFRALPAGTCVVSASTQASAGSKQVAVEQGKLSALKVELSQKAFSLPDMALVLAAVAVLAFIAYRALLHGRKAKLPEGAEAKSGVQKAPVKKKAVRKGKAAVRPAEKPMFDVNNEKARAVLSTLSEREAEIARFLLSSGGRAKRSTMQHKLLIPKTSLLRNLRALERKNIAKLTPFGRNLVAEINKGLFE
ncbi:MAG: hypothetical protein WC717_01395 [Candidatus Micrarchaeia archaeon]|jgi:uncharacterized membrane protein